MDLAPTSSGAWRESFDRMGFAIIDRVVAFDQVVELIEVTRLCSPAGKAGVLDRGGEVYGVRDLIWRIPEIRHLARSPELLEIAQAILGPGAFAVRGLFFDKTLSTNWNLPWHQDLTIAVRTRREVCGFGGWTKKAGIPHVQAPADLLARMVTIRLHLDDCGRESGPLRVLPASHAAGRLDPTDVASWSGLRGRAGRRLSCSRGRGRGHATPALARLGFGDGARTPPRDPSGVRGRKPPRWARVVRVSVRSTIHPESGLNVDARPGKARNRNGAMLNLKERTQQSEMSIQPCSPLWMPQGGGLAGSGSSAAEFVPWRISPRR